MGNNLTENIMTKIVVTKRAGDYHACINGNPKLWGCGDTISEAIKQAYLRRHLTAWEYYNKKRIEMNEQENARVQTTI